MSKDLDKILNLIQARRFPNEDDDEFILGTVGHEEAKAAIQAYLYQEILELLPEKQLNPRTDHSPDDFASGYCMGHDIVIDEITAKAKAKYGGK